MKLFHIELCNGNKGCPNSLINTSDLVEQLNKLSESENIEEFIRKKVKGPIRQHNFFRIGLSNCPNACSQVQIKDIGIIAKVKIDVDSNKCTKCGNCTKVCFEGALKIKEKGIKFISENCIGCGMCVKVCNEEAINIVERGYAILAGGKLGRHPKLAVEIADFVSLNEIVKICRKLIKYYKENSIFGERLGAIFQRKNLTDKDIKQLFQ